MDVPLFALPEQVRRGHVRQKEYILRPRSTRSRVKGHLRLELSFLPRGTRPQPTLDGDDELNPASSEPVIAHGAGLAPLASTDNLEEVMVMAVFLFSILLLFLYSFVLFVFHVLHLPSPSPLPFLLLFSLLILLRLLLLLSLLPSLSLRLTRVVSELGSTNRDSE